MAFRVNTNVSSLNTQRWLGISGANQAKGLERLSSGYKINKASDDAAGMAIASKLNVKSVSMTKAIDNGNQALSMLQTAEGGIDQISNILTRLKEIATQSASDNTTDRTALDNERSYLETEIGNIRSNTQYGTTGLLQGGATVASSGTSLSAGNGVANIDVTSAAAGNYTFTSTAVVAGGATLSLSSTAGGTQTMYVSGLTGFNEISANFSTMGVKVTVNSALAVNAGASAATSGFTVTTGSSSFTYQMGDTNQTMNQVGVSIADFAVTAAVLNITAGSNISSKTAAQAYMTLIDTAMNNLTTQRGNLGASMNQISYHVANLSTMSENIKSSVSTIKDADFAAEMADFTKNQILQQSGVAMLAQANSIPQQVLSLLKG
jgi:flagellin